METPISELLLPRKKGFVEVCIDGVHLYRRYEDKILFNADMTPLNGEPPKTKDELLFGLVERNEFLEDCIAEMASVVYGGDEE